MKKHEAPVPRPGKAERDVVRRDEIVTAAKACVVKHGFHAASMAQIAAQARMSVGQIYRYFPSKDAIVHAIVERMIEHRLARMVQPGELVRLIEALASRQLDESPGDADDRTLLLEITAEATRSAEVAAIVRRADRMLHAQAVAMVRQEHPQFSEAEAAARVEVMAVLFEGTAFRSSTERRADPALLAALYGDIVERLMPGAQAAERAKLAASAPPGEPPAGRRKAATRTR